LFFQELSVLELSKRDSSLYKTDMPIHFLSFCVIRHEKASHNLHLCVYGQLSL
jgi:hypothetical protein